MCKSSWAQASPIIRSAPRSIASIFFFFNDTATTEIYTLSLHDALPISFAQHFEDIERCSAGCRREVLTRSEEHTSELQSLAYLVCRLLLEKTQQRRHHQPPPRPAATHPGPAHAGCHT